MKTEFKIFFSWLSDLPDKDNRNLIRKTLQKEAKAIAKELNVKIIIDSDNRGEDGKDNIDDSILRKIASSDLFVADITPISKSFRFFGKSKYTPNPNVMYELGYAASTLGWNRCIMLWNTKYGDVEQAPFDIRNHSINVYKSPESPNIHELLHKKISDYENLVRDFVANKERSFDIEKYKAITNICSERNLIDSIDSFFTNRVYNKLEFEWWDNIYYNYTHYPDNRFLDDEIHKLYGIFIDNLHEMTLIAAKYNEQSSYSERPISEISTDDYKRECIFSIQDPYKYLEHDAALKRENEIEAAFVNLWEPLINSYKEFRDCVRKKLLI